MFPQPNWLIKYEDYTEAIYKRPGATEFLEYCFRTFRAVGIWTASISERANRLLRLFYHLGVHSHFYLPVSTAKKAKQMNTTNHLAICGTARFYAKQAFHRATQY